jgi:predicted ArsR family transcriptional regulator
LQKYRSDTVEGLAKNIGLAQATIRRHLDILQRDRLVAFREVRKRTGRPEYSFYLTDAGQEALPKDYGHFLGMIVQELSLLTTGDMAARNGRQVLDLVFQRLSAEVTSEYEDELAGKDLPQRLSTLMGHLGEHNFSPEADMDGGTLRISLLNCPFRSVALQSKAVCSFDLNLISSMLDLDAHRAECIHDGDGGCIYTVPIGVERQEELLTTAMKQRDPLSVSPTHT